jgi:hypothetical protein
MGGILGAVYGAVGGLMSKDIWLGGSGNRLQWETLVGGAAAIVAAF